jgi:hypothetical protein
MEKPQANLVFDGFFWNSQTNGVNELAPRTGIMYHDYDDYPT